MTTPPPTPGSLAELLDKKQTLEGNVQSLTHLRDQLALALVTMEQNTDRITAWLKDNREEIIVTRQQLMRALASKKADKLRAFTTGAANGKYSKDIIGFLLSDGEIIKTATALLGANNPEVIALNGIPAGMPAHLIEALPALNVPDDIAENITQMQKAMAPANAPAKPAEKPKGGVLSGWFKNQEQRDTENAEAAYEGMLTHWRQIQRDLIGLQSDRHYYIDSFMDWVGENLSPSTPDQNFAALMTQYRHPSYVIARAQEDYTQALTIRSKALLDDSTTYSNVAQLLDNQDIATFIKDLPLLFPRPDMPAAAEMRRLLLADFSATSFADIALDHVQKPADRLALFEASIAFEGRLKIKGSTKAETLYAAVQAAVLDRKNPLPVKALTTTLRSLSGRDADLNLRAIVRSEDTLVKITAHFGDDDAAYATALSALLAGFGAGVDTDCAQLFVTLRRAAIDKDSVALANAMSAIATPEMAADVRALWDMTMRGSSNTGISLTGIIEDSCKGNIKTFVPLLAQAMSLGLAREITLEGLSSTRDEQAFSTAVAIIRTLLDNKNIEHVSPSAIALVLAANRTETDATARANWMDIIKGNRGLIAQVAAHDTLPDLQKLNVIAALLSPVSSIVEKTALLENTAAGIAGAPQHARTAGLLRDAARALIGDIYPADTDSYLANPERIANIWYAADTDKSGTLFFTLGGKTQVFSSKVSQTTAENLLDIMHHRYGFMRESMGLFNPALADGFEHSNNGTRIVWDMHEAPLNITGLQRLDLQSMAGMVHATATDSKGEITHTSMRPRAILALLPMPDNGQWLMIDRNGSHKIVDSLVLPKDEAPLVRMGNAFVNPDRASLLSIDDAGQTLSLRVENPVFAQLLEGMAREGGLEGFYSADRQYIKVTAASKAQWQACKDAIDANPAQLAAEGDLSHMRFNIDTLGFITAYAEPKSAGIQYSHKNKGGVSGRIELDDDMVGELPKIIASLGKSASRSDKMLVVPAGGMMSELIVHADHIHNIFYQAKQQALIMITEHSDLRPSISKTDAMRAMGKIAKLPGWEGIDNRSLAEDMARLDLATMMYWDKDDGSANALIGNRVVALGMTRNDFASFVATRIAAASAPVAGVLDTPLMRQFNQACANNRVRPQDLPAPRKSAHPRDLLAQVTSPSHSDMGRNSVKKQYLDDEYTDIMKKQKSYNKHQIKGYKF